MSGGLFGDRTYAQHGDDLVLACIFWKLHIEKPSYLSLGAHHPFHLSNTALFYERGSRGINVEANSDLMGEFAKHRPEDINVNVAVGPERGELPFYISFSDSGCNSLKEENARRFKPITTKRIIKVVTVTDIVDSYAGGKYPDILDIDIEGMDYPVLATMDFTQGPKVICAEAFIGPEETETELIMQLLTKAGYFFCFRACNNVIFVRQEYQSQMY